MKKLLIVLSILIFAVVQAKAAVKFDEAFSNCSSKPALVLIYANWAPNYQGILEQFRTAQQELGSNFNYVELDVADKDAASFNSKYAIMPNIPYILMIRAGGKITYYADRNCVSNSSCIVSKAKTFSR